MNRVYLVGQYSKSFKETNHFWFNCDHPKGKGKTAWVGYPNISSLLTETVHDTKVWAKNSNNDTFKLELIYD